MGTGHLMRCLALAECLRERGAEARFICRAHPGNLVALLQERRMPVAVLPAPDASPLANGTGAAEWLGTTQAEDAEQTIAALGSGQPDWLVVDHYGVDAEWEEMLRPRVSRLLVIDDLANRRHDCDALLDQNYSHRGPERYADRVPEQCGMLLGPRYALMRPEYAACREVAGSRDGTVRRVLVFLGGSDPDDVTGRALDAISDPQFGALEVDIVAGANYPHRASLEAKVAARPGTRLHGPKPHLAGLMSRADLAIGAGGATTWERMCLGLPSLVVSIADNQVPACEALAADGLIHYLGEDGDVDASAIRAALAGALHAAGVRARQSSESRAAVDGLGALRIAEFLDPTTGNELTLRPAGPEHVDLYFAWVNDPEVRRQALRSETVKLSQHRQWFAAKLAEPASRLFVMEARGLPVGQIRFDLDAGETTIDYSIECTFRGRGWARQLVALGLRQMRQCDPGIFRADVKESNLASRAVFRGLGFADSTSAADAELRVYRLDARTHG